MVALYPHPEVYRRAMRFFDLRRLPEEAFRFGLRLLDLVPDDAEAQSNVTRFVLQGDFVASHGFISRISRRPIEGVDTHRLVSIAQCVYRRGELTVAERIRLADILEDMNQQELAHGIITSCLETGIEDPEMRITAMGIAARTAMKLGKTDTAAGLISQIPASRLQGGLALVAIQLKVAGGDKEGAFELAKAVLSRDVNLSVVEQAIGLSHDLGRLPEVEQRFGQILSWRSSSYIILSCVGNWSGSVLICRSSVSGLLQADISVFSAEGGGDVVGGLMVRPAA